MGCKLKIAVVIAYILFPVIYSFSASDLSFFKEWDKHYNENQQKLDSFFISNKNQYFELDDYKKFEIIFYSQELFNYTDSKSRFYTIINQSLENESLNFLIGIHKRLCEKDTILKADFDRLLDLSSLRYSTHIDGIINLILSEVYLQRKDVGNSLNYADRAINRGRLGSFRNLLGISFLLKTEIYFSEKLTERAYANSQKGLFYAKRYNSSFWQVQLSQKLGEIQFSIDNYSMARDHWENAYLIADNCTHEILSAKLIKNLANAYLFLGNLKTASEFLNEALVVFYHYSQTKEIARTHYLQGQVLYLLGEYDLAERNFKLSLTYTKEMPSIKGDIYSSLAELFLVKSQADRSLDYANKAMDILEEGSNEYYELIRLKADIYNALNNPKKSNELYRTYILARERLRRDELQSRIAELNSLFRSEQKERKIIEQQQILDEQENELLLNIQKLENEQLRIRQLFFLIVFIVLLFGVIISLVSLRSKQNKLQQEHKSSELKQTLLRSQMNPHFIFNSFSIIQSYIYDNDKEASSQFLVNFSRLIRMILENSSKEVIPLQDEVDILKRYLYVQKIRFEDRFQYEVVIEEGLKNELQNIQIPPMIAQPFIENAIEHSELQKVKDGKIAISLSKKESLIEFIIQDNGIGFKEGQKRKNKSHKSMAIEITRERIDLLNRTFGVNGYVEIIDLQEIEQHGTRVVVQIPYLKMH